MVDENAICTQQRRNPAITVPSVIAGKLDGFCGDLVFIRSLD